MLIKRKLMNIVLREGEGEGEDGGGGGGGGGEGEVSWRDGLPEDIRDNASLVDFKDINGLAKSFIDTKSAMGNAIRVPGEDAGDEARTEFNAKLLAAAPNLMLKPDFDNPEQSAEFFRSLGAPDAVGGYELPEVEGLNYPEERANVLRKAALEVGATKKQFTGMMKIAMEADAAAIVARNEQLAEGMKELKTEWGMAYDTNHKTAILMAEKTGAPESLVEAMKNGQTGPDVFKWLQSLSTKFGPEGQQMLNQEDGGAEKASIPAEAQAQIDEIMANKKHPYWVASDPGHKAALDKMIKLQKMVEPNTG